LVEPTIGLTERGLFIFYSGTDGTFPVFTTKLGNVPSVPGFGTTGVRTNASASYTLYNSTAGDIKVQTTINSCASGTPSNLYDVHFVLTRLQ
jgi:hypothetical protein